MKNEKSGFLNILLELGKVRITVAVAITTAVGYLLHNPVFNMQLVTVSIGVFILSMGSSTFNHVQEWKYDKLMKRTKKRPIPSGKISPSIAFGIGGLLSSLGLLIIAMSSNLEAFVLGLLALFWYNAFYTPLKRVTTLAVVPGAFVGAIPPMIGWAAAGGLIFSPTIWVLGIFIFIWQIPHFWLLLLTYDDDYKSAGYPVLTDLLSYAQLSRITFMWIVSLVISSLIVPFFGLINELWMIIIFFALAVFIIIRSVYLLRGELEWQKVKKTFLDINLFVLLVLILIVIDRLI